jgi:CRP-like cAMP-binding protein
MIYNQDQPSTCLYLVMDGKVKISRLADGGSPVIIDIYPLLSKTDLTQRTAC